MHDRRGQTCSGSWLFPPDSDPTLVHDNVWKRLVAERCSHLDRGAERLQPPCPLLLWCRPSCGTPLFQGNVVQPLPQKTATALAAGRWCSIFRHMAAMVSRGTGGQRGNTSTDGKQGEDIAAGLPNPWCHHCGHWEWQEHRLIVDPHSRVTEKRSHVYPGPIGSHQGVE